MNHQELWESLKEYIHNGVIEGYDRGFNTQFDTWEHGAFFVYRELYDKMCKLEEVGVYNWD